MNMNQTFNKNDEVELTLSLDTPFFEMVIPNATITIKGNNVEKVIPVGYAEKIILAKESRISSLSSSSTSITMEIDGYFIEFNSNSPMKFSGNYSFIIDDSEEKPIEHSHTFKENSVISVSTVLGSLADSGNNAGMTV